MSDGTPIQRTHSAESDRLIAARHLLRQGRARAAPCFLARVTRIRCLNSTDSEGFGYLHRVGLLPRPGLRTVGQQTEQIEKSAIGEPLA